MALYKLDLFLQLSMAVLVFIDPGEPLTSVFQSKLEVYKISFANMLTDYIADYITCKHFNKCSKTHNAPDSQTV